MFITAPVAINNQIHEIHVKIAGYVQKFSIQDLGDSINIFIGDVLDNENPNYVYFKSTPPIDQSSSTEFYFREVVHAYLNR